MATQQTNGPTKTFIAGAAFSAPFLAVKITGVNTNGDPVVGLAGAADAVDGITQDYAESGEPVTVRLLTAGTCVITSSANLAAGLLVEPAANGKWATAASTPSGTLMRLCETASGDGSQVEAVFVGYVILPA